MKKKHTEYGPEVPNYATLNEQLRQQNQAASGQVKRQRKAKGQSHPEADKPK